MFYVVSRGQDDEQFMVGRHGTDCNGRITFVRLPQTFRSRAQAEKVAKQLNREMERA